MMSLTFGLFTQVSDSGPQGPLVHSNIIHCGTGVKLIPKSSSNEYFLELRQITVLPSASRRKTCIAFLTLDMAVA